jgi:hypothetical protein
MQQSGGSWFEASLGKQFERSYLEKKKNLSQKRADGVAQSVGPYFKSQYHKKEKKNGASEWLEGMNKHAISPKSLLLTSWAHKITFRHTQPAQYT